MTGFSDLIPELGCWNGGAGIAPEDWIYIEGRADHALGFSSLFWPDLLLFEGYVLRGPLNVDRLRAWERAGHGRQQVETAMNVLLMDDIFPNDQTENELKIRQVERLAIVMVDMLTAKLIRDYPDRRFSTFVMQGDDFGISFHQASLL